MSACEPANPASDLFFELAVDDITRAADLFRPVHERTDGVDGWVSLEVSPLLAHDTQRRWQRPGICTHAPAGRMSSSRFRAPTKGCPRSRRRSSPAFRST